MVEVFGDMRPMYGVDDARLPLLQKVAEWFLAWEQAVADSDLTKAEKKAALPSQETRDDTISVLYGFQEFVVNHFKQKGAAAIIPGRVNSDVCENFFCQQRSMCHGSNDNPTHWQYQYGINTIIYSQTPISRKSNAFSKDKENMFTEPPAKLRKK